MPSGFDNDVMFAKNADFSLDPLGVSEANGLFANGELWIGRTVADANGAHVNVNTLTAGAGISIVNGPGTITIAAAGGALAVDSFAMQTGTTPVVPTGTGLVTFNGAVVAAGVNPVRTDGTGPNTMALEVQRSQAIGATDATKVGLAVFDSAKFTVDANGFVSMAGGGTTQTLTPDVGGAVSPSLNNINILGSTSTLPTDSMVTHNFGGVATMGIENRRWQTAFIVDPSAVVGVRGTYQTIQAAVTAATAGQTIFVRDGTYTENVTLKPGVSICGWPSEGSTGEFRATATSNVTIVGKLTLSSAGFCSLANLRLQTNGDYCLVISGAVNANVLLKNCFIYCSNNTGINLTSTAGAASLQDCNGDIGIAGITYFTRSGGGNITIDGGAFYNSGNSTTASTWADGILTIRNCEFDCPISSSSATAGCNLYNVWMNYAAANTTMITYNSTNATPGSVWNCFILSGTASAISIGAGASLRVMDCYISSDNTNAITGAGSVLFGELMFPSLGSDPSNIINTTTQASFVTSPDRVRVTTPAAYPYTTLVNDYVIKVDTSAARTIIPLASPKTGQTYVIKDTVGTAAAFNITVTPSGKNIDGAASYTINSNYGSITIVYNGTEWSVI